MSLVTEDDIELLIRTRRQLHARPELSHEETQTTEFIIDFLKTHAAPDEILPLSETGLICVFRGVENGPTTLVRGDIDALPIEESDELPYHSKNPKAAHKCGHDGHTTILLGLAMALSSNKPRRGEVLLLFQPAEELGEGATVVMSDQVYRQFKIDRAFALHNLPKQPAHAILIREGVFTANVKSLVIKLGGKTAHAGEPENGQNPAMTIARLLLEAEKLTYNEPSSESFFLMTPVFATLGKKAYGVSAGKGELHFTIRAWDTRLFDRKCDHFLEQVKELSQEAGLSVDISWTQEFEANNNHPEAVQLIRTAAEQLGLDLIELESPFKWGEDFGKFTQNLKGAMFGLGAGNDVKALHHPEYDFPDGIIQTGVHIFNQIITEIHGSTSTYDQD